MGTLLRWRRTHPDGSKPRMLVDRVRSGGDCGSTSAQPCAVPWPGTRAGGRDRCRVAAHQARRQPRFPGPPAAWAHHDRVARDAGGAAVVRARIVTGRPRGVAAAVRRGEECTEHVYASRGSRTRPTARPSRGRPLPRSSTGRRCLRGSRRTRISGQPIRQPPPAGQAMRGVRLRWQGAYPRRGRVAVSGGPSPPARPRRRDPPGHRRSRCGVLV